MTIGRGEEREGCDSAETSSLALPLHASSPAEELASIKVQFADDAGVPFPFRGRSVSVKAAKHFKVLSVRSGETIFAKTEQGAVWCGSLSGKAHHFRSAFALPAVSDGGLQDILNGNRFVELLPLLHFLRTLCEDELTTPPPLRAQFMFDDPNLHWPSYGYVDYREVAQRAEKENYHVSFATVPLDAWMTHGGTAEIFRRNSKGLSFCVHGNNHTKRELAQPYSATERATLVQQAVRRIEGLEQKAGVEVSRVMVPPHGACSHEMLEELSQHGFESACISHGSLRAHNRHRSWVKQLGYLPSEMIGNCPVLPRWGLATSNENTILLAAYLRQAIVLRGHHQDIKQGIEVLDSFARIINGLGDVIWTNMAEISRRNYVSRLEGAAFKIQPLGKKLSITVPEAANSLLLESNETDGSSCWRVLDVNASPIDIRKGEKIPLPAGKRRITLERALGTPVAANLNGHTLPVGAIVRRLLTEGRDRLVGTLGR